MPRPTPRTITFSIDGREVQADENMMLVDAAKLGDVEIPVFCYEPKLGAPVGACRMCLVEIEGIPKLQTACSTPVKDGMVVHTQNARVKEAQEAVVEFLLVNHPLDCPVCDKGGECPLQDISFGWGGGKSRFVEPKRHFEKPLALSPLIAIDRERCILCYRCVRFSQEVSEDYQLVLHERGAATYVGTFDSHPYVAPFSGNIIELCPVGALTSRPYRFRARPWDIEGGGTVCTLCPSQCNVHLTVRDERVLRVLARQHDGVDDGWLCDKGRFAYQAIHADERVTAPMVRDGGVLREVSWERALGEAASALGRMHGKVAALAGGDTTNEEAFLVQRIVREALGGQDLDSAPGIAARDLHALARPDLQASVPDLEFAHTVLVLGTEPVDDMPIVDLRIRKGVRRNRVKLAVATSRPSSLDANAALSVRFAPGGEAAFVSGLAAAIYGGDVDGPARAAGCDADALRSLAEMLRTGAGGNDGPPTAGDVVILYGQRLLRGTSGVAQALQKIAGGLNIVGREGAGLLAVPDATNGRGIAEAGFLPGYGPGYVAGPEGRDAAGIADGLRDGDLTALYLLHTDPIRDSGDAPGWDAALEKASYVVAHAQYLTEGVREHANVVFPAESHAEKEGTLTHPDGRVQRLRPAIGRQDQVRPEWQVLNDLAGRLDLDLGVLTGAMATTQLVEAVPFYAGITLNALGGTGLRWPATDPGAQAFPEPAADPAGTDGALAAATPSQGGRRENGGVSDLGALRLGTFRSIWASPEVEVAPALKFLAPRQKVEIAPADAERLDVRHGEAVTVGGDGITVDAVVHVRANAPEGTVFLQTGIADGSANVLGGPLVEIVGRDREPAVVGAPAAEADAEPDSAGDDTVPSEAPTPEETDAHRTDEVDASPETVEGAPADQAHNPEGEA
ncbi:NADH-quinone oxidoreductase subunit NuoG [Paraconexibacter sp.]|uniref:NADH-quinone oxidoreductase subunit NuoG n=1 Tax=Paraconexibacter sp. TaxID=2949640 RepID=UPI003567250A